MTLERQAKENEKQKPEQSAAAKIWVGEDGLNTCVSANEWMSVILQW